MQINHIKKILANNSSLIVLLLGALSNFVLILFIQRDFPDVFVPLSLYLTYLGIVGSLGFLGFDQVYLRLAKISNSKSEIGLDIYSILFALMFLVPIAFASYFARYEYLKFWELYVSGLSINAIMLGFNANRLQSKFTIAQVLKNFYKLMFLLGAWFILIVIDKPNSIRDLFYYASLIMLFSGALSLISFWRKTEFKFERSTKLLQFSVSFGLNIILITMLGYGERILIADKIDQQTFATYFYYLTIFLFPLTLLQEYVGFKELVYFKEKVNKQVVYKKLKRLLLLGLFTYALIIIVIWIDDSRFLRVDLTKDFVLIACMSILGLVKLTYSLFSAILGARGESKSINFINKLTTLIIAVLWLLMHLLGYSLNAILISLILVFLYRSTHTYALYVR